MRKDYAEMVDNVISDSEVKLGQGVNWDQIAEQIADVIINLEGEESEKTTDGEMIEDMLRNDLRFAIERALNAKGWEVL